jgi:predicted GNAT superfamily acetyltransferase
MDQEINDLHNELSEREGLLRVNNASGKETSLLSRETFDRLVASASVATFIRSSTAFLLAFQQTDDYDGGHFCGSVVVSKGFCIWTVLS